VLFDETYPLSDSELRLYNSMSLAKKAAHGIAWVTLSTILIRIFNFLTKIVLARLLDPTDFGLLAIGLLAINAMGLFRDLGFGAALIYKKTIQTTLLQTPHFYCSPLLPQSQSKNCLCHNSKVSNRPINSE